MLSHDEILAELVRQIDGHQIKQVDVARHLCIAPARVAEMKKGERRIQPHEMKPLAQFLGMLPRNDPAHPVQQTRMVRHLGRVAQGVWLEQSFSDPNEADLVPYDRLAGDPDSEDLFSVTPEGLSMNLIFPPGVKLICQRVPFGVADARNGDLVIVERTNHDLRELTCKRLMIASDGSYFLKSESDQSQYQDAWPIGRPDDNHHNDNEIRIIGKVLRGIIDFTGK